MASGGKKSQRPIRGCFFLRVRVQRMSGVDLNAVAHDANNAGPDAENMSCNCAEPASFLPYCTSGCLRCPKQDTAYYIKNVLSKILERYDTVIEDGGPG